MDTVVDESGVEALRKELARARVEHLGDIHVDCSALNFAGLDALRVLVAAARVLGAGERRLVLAGLSPYFVEVFRVTAWDRTPGLGFTAAATGSRYGCHRRPRTGVAGSPGWRHAAADPPVAGERPTP